MEQKNDDFQVSEKIHIFSNRDNFAKGEIFSIEKK